MYRCRRWRQTCRRRALFAHRFGIPDQELGAKHPNARSPDPGEPRPPRSAKAKLKPGPGQGAQRAPGAGPPPQGPL